MTGFLRWMEDVLWPRGVKCLCCDGFSDGELLCLTCMAALNAMKLDVLDQGSGHFRSVYRHDGAAKQLVLLLKDECLADAAQVLADGMAAAIREMALPKDTILTWVTMPELRRKKRGIDHGRTLCEAVAARTGLEVRQLLVRVGDVHTQRGLDRDARMKNLAGSLKCSGKVSGTVLLIDDVMTTGATSALCAELLMEAGASQVFVMTATRAMLSP